MLVASAEPFYEGLRFRRGRPGECAASECSLFCKDMWAAGKGKFVIDPHVRVAYDLPTYNGLHTVKWLTEGGARGTNRSAVEWPGDTPFPPHPPARVYCCGLEGNGRDADQPCIREEFKMPPRAGKA